jgi:stalled ribosome rescue protein Dom34
MKTQKKLGIWMDHATANLIDTKAKKKSHSIASKFTTEVKDEVSKRSEYTMHNKEEQMNESFYKVISKEILKYNHVLLFGPTNAKTELQNYLNKDLHFKDIPIDIEAADKMTENEQVAFVKKHFECQ